MGGRAQCVTRVQCTLGVRPPGWVGFPSRCWVANPNTPVTHSRPPPAPGPAPESHQLLLAIASVYGKNDSDVKAISRSLRVVENREQAGAPWCAWDGPDRAAHAPLTLCKHWSPS